jgi:hypothetical protein
MFTPFIQIILCQSGLGRWNMTLVTPFSSFSGTIAGPIRIWYRNKMLFCSNIQILFVMTGLLIFSYFFVLRRCHVVEIAPSVVEDIQLLYLE